MVVVNHVAPSAHDENRQTFELRPVPPDTTTGHRHRLAATRRQVERAECGKNVATVKSLRSARYTNGRRQAFD